MAEDLLLERPDKSPACDEFDKIAADGGIIQITGEYYADKSKPAC
jgi:hypothetical protein